VVALRRALGQGGDTGGAVGPDGPHGDVAERRVAAVVDLDVDMGAVALREILAVVDELIESDVGQGIRGSGGPLLAQLGAEPLPLGVSGQVVPEDGEDAQRQGEEREGRLDPKQGAKPSLHGNSPSLGDLAGWAPPPRRGPMLGLSGISCGGWA
jgi:hypothetical protein